MSCVVACIDDYRKVYMGCDSAGIDAEQLDIRVRKDEKIFIKGNMIFGYVHSFRMGQLLRYTFKVPEHPEGMDDYEYFCTLFINEIINCFKENDFIRVLNEGEIYFNGSFMVGYRGKIFLIDPDFQVGIEEKRYAAMGCGDSYAMGAFSAIEYLNFDISANKRVELALNAAAEFSAGVRPPFLIYSLE